MHVPDFSDITRLLHLHMFINRYVSPIMRSVRPLNQNTPEDVIHLIKNYIKKWSIDPVPLKCIR